MPPITSSGMTTSNGNGNEKLREQTLRLVVKGLTSRPAYLIIFGLGLVNTGILGLTMCQDSDAVVILSFGAWFMYCVISLAVVYRIEVNPKRSEEDIADATAIDEFRKGSDASFLAGEWMSEWLPAVSSDPVKPEKVELNITTNGCRVFICAFAKETGRQFWMWGRLSDNNALALLTWGKFRGGYGGMSGVDFLVIDKDSMAAMALRGTWVGHSKAGDIVSGTTSWLKAGDPCTIREEIGTRATG